jgi:cystathionine beta-lyase
MKNNFAEEKNICMHQGDDYAKYFGSVIPPIFETSTFIFEKYEDICEAFKDERRSFLYTRGTNPTVELLERKLAALEHGEDAKCFASGMAAISAAIDAFTGQGDHILFVNSCYGPALNYAKYLKKYGIEHDILLDVNIEAVEKAIRPNTKVIYVESPGTMTFKLVDLKALATLANSNGIATLIDNTWATPLFQKPLDMGITVSIHSCTKYIGGHSDVVAGVVISTKEIMDRIFSNEFQLHGGSLGPFEAWLLTRGLRTLPLRMKSYQESGLKLAEYFENHNKIEKVNYPGLKSNPDYELGKSQLHGYSGLMSIELKSKRFEDMVKVINACKIFKIAVSWGGFESLILAANHGNNEQELINSGLSPSLIRISAGLEDVDLLIEDLENALKAI